MKKWIFIIVIAGLGIWLVVSIGATCGGDQDNFTEKAPGTLYRVQTASRLYYTDRYTKAGGPEITLHGYYSFENKKWKYYDKDLELSTAYGRVQLIVN